ncbi:MAG: hypothetical protein WBV89_10820, partial [Ilumatobacter sp.]
VVMGEDTVEFSVDQVGVPVLVKVSYFPNWTVSGAEGPYRAGANQMIVVPTETDVTLTYDAHVALDWFFYLLTAIGIGLCFVWRRQGDLEFAGPRPSFRSRSEDDDVPDVGVGAGADWGPPSATARPGDERVDPDGGEARADADDPPLDPTPVQAPMLTADFPEDVSAPEPTDDPPDP